MVAEVKYRIYESLTKNKRIIQSKNIGIKSFKTFLVLKESLYYFNVSVKSLHIERQTDKP